MAAARLVGRGGAAFPTSRKWEAVAGQVAQPHFLVCNADESEPGTFKDRLLLEGDPFGVLEGMTIAAFACGAERGYVYIRGEYPAAATALEGAIEAARAAGLLGDDILGSGWSFDVEIRRGAGAYIAGEETALFESIEGDRAEPRNKPPFPVSHGLFGKPTAINNVETLANVPIILREGGAAYAGIGTQGSTGPKLFCVSGHIARPGLYELPFGGTLRELIDLAGGVPGSRPIKAVLLGGAAGSFVGPEELDVELTFEGTRAIGSTLGSGVVRGLRRDRRSRRHAPANRRVLPRRIVRPVRAVPRWNGAPGRAAPAARGGPAERVARRRARPAARHRAGDARRVDLRPGPDGVVGDRIGLPAPRHGGAVSGPAEGHGTTTPPHGAPTTPPPTPIMLEPPARPTRIPAAPPSTAPAPIEVTVDGRAVSVPAGSTILDACRALGIDTPTLCYLETLTPVNVCRVCVVEVTGSRVLVPACSRPVEAGMAIQTDSERVRLSRRMVLEFLGSSVDLSLAGTRQADGGIVAYMERYGADPTRYGEPAPPAAAGERDALEPGHHHAPDGAVADTVAQPVKIDNELYVRDYSRCILCYKCVEACGVDAQNTFAIGVAGRGFDARISTEWNVGLPDSACVYCGNCIGVCPTGALMFRSEYEMREAGTWDESAQHQTDTICPYCGVGCTLTLHVQDNSIVKVTSPLDASVTEGHLCIKGRFGFQFVQNRGEAAPGE